VALLLDDSDGGSYRVDLVDSLSDADRESDPIRHHWLGRFPAQESISNYITGSFYTGLL